MRQLTKLTSCCFCARAAKRNSWSIPPRRRRWMAAKQEEVPRRPRVATREPQTREPQTQEDLMEGRRFP